MNQPVLLVHGIWDDGTRFDRMREVLGEAGLGPMRAIDLVPNDGSARIERLAEQVEDAARELMRETGESQIDLVGFSMGALVSRFWLQRLRGKERTRRFVSISGPHAGTVTAWAMPKNGARQMRPRSQLLQELDADTDPWGRCEVHTLWTLYDLMILPPRSSQLPGAHADHTVQIPLHRFMITHPKALAKITSILTRP